MEKKTLFKIGLILVAVSWGSGFPVTKIALDSGIAPNALMSIRFLVTALVLFIFFKIKGVAISKEEKRLGLGTGIVLGLAFSLQTVGLVYTTSSKNAFITGAYVVMVPFISWFLTKEKPKLSIYLATVICLFGIGLLSLEGDLSINYGDFLTFICAIFFALQMSLIGANISDKNPITVNTYQMLSAGILTLLLNVVFENFSIFTTRLNITQILAIGFLVVCNTLIAYLVQTAAQTYVPASTTSLILSTEILFGAITSVLFLGDPFTLKMVLGGILIFASVMIAERT
ncbi:DMT family transporter [uncultured Fusobacterium sp.]|uniref:DMT family transporter n=1 Tax=uncultured Fusobacterium sp. TaxID=159267 RepID=UPI0025F4125D|nr:DMT family transporter [uncultured Fusobacterium sp.]